MKKLLEKIAILENRFLATPVYNSIVNERLYMKMENYQLSGSIKIRAAVNMIKYAIINGEVNEETIIIESTSGNFGVALAQICKFLDLRFIAVTDKNTIEYKEKLIRKFGAEVIQISELDENGGYLLNRLRFIKQYISDNHTQSFYNPNQYTNQYNPLAYKSLCSEIIEAVPDISSIIVAVSTGGTIAGIYQGCKDMGIKIIAVDVEGSVIFSEPKKRSLSGIGSSIKSQHLSNIDVSHYLLTEEQIIEGKKLLFDNEQILGGYSSGAAYYASMLHIEKHPDEKVLFIIPDSQIN
jgi:cysteine synthase